MVDFGYALSSEEHPPVDLIKFAKDAEEMGFSFLSVSDHYHPWIEFQGHSPFVWTVLGGIGAVTENVRVGTGVTCPTMRIHPAIIAQAAATTAALMPGRFYLGLGSGEALNEHILGDHWPPATIRLDMLEEAIEIIRLLWEGEETSYWGDFFTVENARLFTLPTELPPIYIAAAGDESASLAGELGDGLINTSPDEKVIQVFKESGGEGKPVIGQITLCYAEDEEEALDTAYKWWPNSVLPGALHADLPTPDHFEQAVQLVRREDMIGKVVYGPDPQKHIEKIQKYIDAGFTHIYFHQIGPNQEAFMRFYQKEVLPQFQKQVR